MKIALIGATGFVGAAILKETLDRGHAITVIAPTSGNTTGTCEGASREALVNQSMTVGQCDIIPIQKVNDAYVRLETSDVKYPFWIEASLKSESYERAAHGNANTEAGVLSEDMDLFDLTVRAAEWKSIGHSLRGCARLCS